MKKLLNFFLNFLILYSIKSQAMTNEQSHQNMRLTYDNHDIEICINENCDQRAFVAKKLSLKNCDLDKLTVQRYARFRTAISHTLKIIFFGFLSYSDVQDKYIEINNCSINHLIIESGIVHLRNVNINHLDVKHDSKVRFGDNCTIYNCTSKD
jgi:hypothetical protein